MRLLAINPPISPKMIKKTINLKRRHNPPYLAESADGLATSLGVSPIGLGVGMPLLAINPLINLKMIKKTTKVRLRRVD
jgi:hypothetical protein